MEKKGDIEPGSMKKLRKEARAVAAHGYKSFQLLANTLGPVISMDSFLPKSSPAAANDDESDMSALCRKPVLVLCCDEERKQLPDETTTMFYYTSRFTIVSLTAMAPNNLLYPLLFALWVCQQNITHFHTKSMS